MNDIFVETVLEETWGVSLTIKPSGIRFVVTKQNLRLAVTSQRVISQFRMLRGNRAALTKGQLRLLRIRLPRPGVAKPQLRQQMNRRRFRPAIVNRHPHQNLFRPGFRVFDKHIEVAVVVEDAGIE